MKMDVLCLIFITGICGVSDWEKENMSMFENALDTELPDAFQILAVFLKYFMHKQKHFS